MKHLAITLLLLFLTVSIEAQNDKKAKALLDEVSNKLKTYENIIIDFKYTITNTKKNINQESQGDITINGNLYVLNFMGFTKMFDGKKVYTIIPEDEEISVSKYNKNDDKTMTPEKMLTFFNSGYTYSWDIVQNIKGRKIQYIKLIPINTKDNRKEILLGIDIETKNIYNKIEIEKDGSRNNLTINSFKTNQPLSKNHFIFTENKYPNYYINYLD